jgi:hypothetical protein|tara:strand:+ start:508 stop:744 length:237 start_codon:yes stop_codon:yes gene_type:complete
MTEAQWTKKIAEKLVGKKIVSVAYMSEADAEKWGWYKRPIMMNLSDGHQLIISQDDEGNDGGSVFTSYDGPIATIPTL